MPSTPSTQPTRDHSIVRRAGYDDAIADFLVRDENEITGRLALSSVFAVEQTQVQAWVTQIRILRNALAAYASDAGKVYFEYAVPRLGRRIDAVLVLRNVLFVIEFKVGESTFPAGAIDQVFDYALDLKNFHETSHGLTVAPVLVATEAASRTINPRLTPHGDRLLEPLRASADDLAQVLSTVLGTVSAPPIDPRTWETGRYAPTPTIIEAAMALYGAHSVVDISRSDAGAMNLTRTSDAISRIIRAARDGRHKSIIFVTGVPGAGKTLVGLNTATQHADVRDKEHSVFLSGNGPLVRVLREALARDKVRREKERGQRTTKVAAHNEVQAFIQNVHHFRDEYAKHDDRAPADHVVIFDEAQRAWDRVQTAAFMKRKRGLAGFDHSEPEFLISCMDRHRDWAVIVCLVGGGQEINTGEAGIGEWIDSVLRQFSGWHVHVSPNLRDEEYGAGAPLARLEGRSNVHYESDLHLSVSMRSFRAEKVSAFVKALLDQKVDEARELYRDVTRTYPIHLTRDMTEARRWLREQARGSERCGLVVSSQAQRLKPCPIGIDVRVQTDPVHYFLGPKEDVRSSYYLEDAATEFDVQGLELDWVGVVWDGDFRYAGGGEDGTAPDHPTARPRPRRAAANTAGGWDHYSFKGDRWERIRKAERQMYLKNAYRVLLTRARQGMVVVVPEGDPRDPTRRTDIYDPTWAYLTRATGIAILGERGRF